MGAATLNVPLLHWHRAGTTSITTHSSCPKCRLDSALMALRITSIVGTTGFTTPGGWLR